MIRSCSCNGGRKNLLPLPQQVCLHCCFPVQLIIAMAPCLESACCLMAMHFKFQGFRAVCLPM